MAEKFKWEFRSKFRARALGWNGSKKAIENLKLALSEIKQVARKDQVLAGDGCVLLASRIWPAFEHIDTSTGALGSAVNKTLEALIPILIDAPASEAERRKWAEKLYTAICEDGVSYLEPIQERFGEILNFRSLQDHYIELTLPSLQQAWSKHDKLVFTQSSTLTLSCLLATEQYEELTKLLARKNTRFWPDEKFAVQALLNQNKRQEAIDYIEELLKADDRGGYNERLASAFLEQLLIEDGRENEAYQRFGLKALTSTTYLSSWRRVTKRYPGIDKRRVLEDLVKAFPPKGKWFAAAKTGGYLDLALEYARDGQSEPATLARAAKEFVNKDPEFAGFVALESIARYVSGGGYEAAPIDLDLPFRCLIESSAALRKTGWARQALERFTNNMAMDALMKKRLVWLLDESFPQPGNNLSN